MTADSKGKFSFFFVALMTWAALCLAPEATYAFKLAECARVVEHWVYQTYFSPTIQLQVGGKTFHVKRGIIGSGNESDLYQLADDPTKVLKVFVNRSNSDLSGGAIHISFDMNSLGYVSEWVRRLKSFEDSEHHVVKVYDFGQGYVLRDYVKGISPSRINRQPWTPEKKRRVQEDYKRLWLSNSRSVDGAWRSGDDVNILYDLDHETWVVIDP